MKRIGFLLVLAALLCVPAASDDNGQGKGRAMTPVGAWDVIVTPEGPSGLSFHSFINYNFGGTVTAANSACNAIARTAGIGLRCSDSYGVWKRIGRKRFVQTFVLEAFTPDDAHSGFIKVKGVFVMEGKNRLSGYNESFYLVGTDLENPDTVIPLNKETWGGRRIVAEAPGS